MALLFFFLLTTVYSQDKQIRTLFIGNSLTYWNDMPDIFQAISREQGKKVKVKQIVFPGISLWNQLVTAPVIKGGVTVTSPLSPGQLSPADSSIRRKKWDYIVLQDRWWRQENLRKAVLYIDSLKGNSEAKIILYQNFSTILWSDSLRWEEVSASRDTFRLLAELTRGKVLRIGEVFHWFNIYKPEYELFPDNTHPSEMGSFLIALLIFQEIFPHSRLREGRLLENFQELPVSELLKDLKNFDRNIKNR